MGSIARFGTSRASEGDFVRLAPFIEENPEAVFVKYTNVSDKLDVEAFERAGWELARQVFVRGDSGLPLSGRVVFKPNITASDDIHSSSLIDPTMGINTSPHFVAGIIDGLKELGLSDFCIVESGGQAKTRNIRGFTVMARDKGVTFPDYTPSARKSYRDYSDEELTWFEVPNGVIFKRIPLLWPVQTPDSMLINVPTFKAHNLGIMTLCTKNQQGLSPLTYKSYCNTLSKVKGYDTEVKQSFQDDLEQSVIDGSRRHTEEGYNNGRWDAEGTRDEIWAQRTTDGLSTIFPDLNLIEGIVGRDGDGFYRGTDYLTNILIFGKHRLKVDVIGTYLAGHWPGNIGYMRIARERGVTDTIDPYKIDVYELAGDDNLAHVEDVGMLPKYGIGVYHYRNYDAGLVFFGDPVTGVKDREEETAFSRAFSLDQNRPNPFNPGTEVAFRVPHAGDVELTIYDVLGRKVTTMVDGHLSSGFHHAAWNGRDRFGGEAASGTYLARLSWGGLHRTIKMMKMR